MGLFPNHKKIKKHLPSTIISHIINALGHGSLELGLTAPHHNCRVCAVTERKGELLTLPQGE